MKKLPSYRYIRRGRRAAIVIQTRDPQTRKAIHAADLKPYRAITGINSPVGRLPARTLCFLLESTAASMDPEKLEPLRDIVPMIE